MRIDINRIYFANQWWNVSEFEWKPEWTTGQTWVRVMAHPNYETFPGSENHPSHWEIMVPLNQVVAIAEEWH